MDSGAFLGRDWQQAPSSIGRGNGGPGRYTEGMDVLRLRLNLNGTLVACLSSVKVPLVVESGMSQGRGGAAHVSVCADES